MFRILALLVVISVCARAEPLRFHGYARLSGTTVYGSDVVLTIGGAKLSSPTGVMISNQAQSLISGDLLVQSGDFVFSTSQATVRVTEGKVSLVAKTLTASPKKSFEH